MSGRALGHRHLHVHGSSLVHRLAPQAKLAGLVAFVVVVALTPRQWVSVFAAHAAVLVAVIALARLSVWVILGRLAAIVPFVAFALALPFIGDGDTVELGPVALSVDGLWAGFNILAKAALGATASIVVTATTPIPDLLTGLARLRVPAVIVGIVGFMFRYLDLIVNELARMRRAMVARGYNPRWLWQARPIASSAGALFVRTYERGERVHASMTARGYTGTMPDLEPRQPASRDWVMALSPALVAATAVTAVGLA